MKLIAHRGKDNHKYYENTKEALLWCLKQDYIDGVELDVRLTKDKKLIMYHNTSLVNLGIDRKFIANENLKDLRKINLGTKERPYYIQTLEEFLNKVKSNKIIIIDVKKEIGSIDEELEILEKIICKYRSLQIFVCSFCYGIVKLSTSMCITFVGLIISDLINKKKDYKKFNFLSLSKGSFNDIKTNKIKMVWTVNKKSELNKFKKADYIITDNAYLLA